MQRCLASAVGRPSRRAAQGAHSKAQAMLRTQAATTTCRRARGVAWCRRRPPKTPRTACTWHLIERARPPACGRPHRCAHRIPTRSNAVGGPAPDSYSPAPHYTCPRQSGLALSLGMQAEVYSRTRTLGWMHTESLSRWCQRDLHKMPVRGARHVRLPTAKQAGGTFGDAHATGPAAPTRRARRLGTAAPPAPPLWAGRLNYSIQQARLQEN